MTDQTDIWIPYQSGSTIGQRGSDDGVIVLDEQYAQNARITLERDCEGYGKPPIPYSITCGAYGWMMHTCFLNSEAQARRQFDDMKTALAAIVDRLPDSEQEIPDEILDAVHDFVDRYP
jgi:hypothetical protein